MRKEMGSVDGRIGLVIGLETNYRSQVATPKLNEEMRGCKSDISKYNVSRRNKLSKDISFRYSYCELVRIE